MWKKREEVTLLGLQVVDSNATVAGLAPRV